MSRYQKYKDIQDRKPSKLAMRIMKAVADYLGELGNCNEEELRRGADLVDMCFRLEDAGMLTDGSLRGIAGDPHAQDNPAGMLEHLASELLQRRATIRNAANAMLSRARRGPDVSRDDLERWARTLLGDLDQSTPPM